MRDMLFIAHRERHQADGEEMIKFELPLPPSVNRIWRRSCYGGVYLIQEAIDFYHEAIPVIKKEMRKSKRTFPITGDVELLITFYFKRGDCDNRIKCCFDVLQKAGLIEDDKQITKFAVEKIKAVKTKVVISLIERS